MLKCKVCKNKKDIEKLQKEIVKLQNQLNQISQISEDNINLGSSTNPIDNIFTTNIVSSDFSLKGINLDDDTANLTPPVDEKQIIFPQNWLTTNKPISSFRTFHYNLNTPNWIKWGVENNLEVMIGITLENYEVELNNLSNDYLSDSILKSKYDINIIAIAIGNEKSDITQMNKGMLYAKTLISSGKLPKNAKVTTVLTNGNSEWFISTTKPNEKYTPMNTIFTQNFFELYPNMDIICFNLYDGYSLINPDVSIEVKLSWTNPSVTLNGFGAVRFALDAASKTQKPFWCTEIGWESDFSKKDPNNKNGSLPNLRKFYSNFLLFNMDSNFTPEASTRSVKPPDRIFYFTIRDANNETFGLYTNNNKILDPKF